MADDVQMQEEGKPLTREDVLRLLKEAGSSQLLDLSLKNLNRINLSGGINLKGINLQRADLENANLEGADLSYANLKDVDLKNADLKNADLQGTDLRRADLSYANLGGADLKNADLQGADLSYANLQGVDVTQANLEDVIWNITEGFKAVNNKNVEYAGKEKNITSFTLNINAEPLTACGFANFITTINELYIKIWLIAQNRIGDLERFDFCNNHNEKPFLQEAGLLIGKLSHNSPAWVEFFTNAAAGAAAITSIPRLIQSFLMIPTNLDKAKKDAALDIESREVDLAQKKLKLLKELKEEFPLDDTQAQKAQESILKTLSHFHFANNEITVK